MSLLGFYQSSENVLHLNTSLLKRLSANLRKKNHAIEMQ